MLMHTSTSWIISLPQGKQKVHQLHSGLLRCSSILSLTPRQMLCCLHLALCWIILAGPPNNIVCSRLSSESSFRALSLASQGFPEFLFGADILLTADSHFCVNNTPNERERNTRSRVCTHTRQPNHSRAPWGTHLRYYLQTPR